MSLAADIKSPRGCKKNLNARRGIVYAVSGTLWAPSRARPACFGSSGGVSGFRGLGFMFWGLRFKGLGFRDFRSMGSGQGNCWWSVEFGV